MNWNSHLCKVRFWSVSRIMWPEKLLAFQRHIATVIVLMKRLSSLLTSTSVRCFILEWPHCVHRIRNLVRVALMNCRQFSPNSVGKENYRVQRNDMVAEACANLLRDVLILKYRSPKFQACTTTRDGSHSVGWDLNVCSNSPADDLSLDGPSFRWGRHEVWKKLKQQLSYCSSCVSTTRHEEFSINNRKRRAKKQKFMLENIFTLKAFQQEQSDL